MATPAIQQRTGAWWSYGHVWLIISGPLVVVIASFVTLWLAIRTPDPLVEENYYQRGVEINKTMDANGRSLVPALQGRNHAATPGAVTPRR